MLSFFNHLLFITLMNIKSLTKPDLKKKFVLFFNFDNQMGMGWDLCVGLLYEHRFAMLIKFSGKLAHFWPILVSDNIPSFFGRVDQ